MQLTVISKFLLLFLLCFCLFNTACGQTEKEKTDKFHQHGVKSFALRQKGDLAGAIEEQKKAVKLKPQYWESLTVLAGLYLNLYDRSRVKEDLEIAKELLTRALDINPNDAIGRDMLAGTYNRLGDKQETLKQMTEVVRLSPGDLSGLTNFGTAQNDIGDYKSARETFEKVLQKKPNYAYALYHYAEMELEENNRAKAIELFERGSKAAASDNNNDTEYIETCRNRLVELRSEKSKTAKP